jgi:hypothetical protein
VGLGRGEHGQIAKRLALIDRAQVLEESRPESVRPRRAGRTGPGRRSASIRSRRRVPAHANLALIVPQCGCPTYRSQHRSGHLPAGPRNWRRAAALAFLPCACTLMGHRRRFRSWLIAAIRAWLAVLRVSESGSRQGPRASASARRIAPGSRACLAMRRTRSTMPRIAGQYRPRSSAQRHQLPGWR